MSSFGPQGPGMGMAAAPALMRCVVCGLQVPTKPVTFHQNIGMLVTRQTSQASGEMCRNCSAAYFKSFTLTTFFLGWWGMISFIVTPIFLVNNLWQYAKTRSLPEPLSATGEMPRPVEVGSGNPTLKLIYGAVVVVVLLGVIAYNSTEFMEKHAPSINAQLHNGDITDDSDAEYSGIQIAKDIEALTAPINSKDWAGMRTEYLSREGALTDLKHQNAKLQRVADAERSGTATIDACERLALDEYMPALNDYTHALDEGYAVIKSTVTPTKEAGEALESFGAKEDDALGRLKAFYEHNRAQGCK